jgi:biopolymer transport protein ExbD
MRQWQQTQRKKARIEIIPMIDVMMFLLVFFVLISVNVIPALGIKTQQPNSSQAQQLKTKDVQVVVTLGVGHHCDCGTVIGLTWNHFGYF